MLPLLSNGDSWFCEAKPLEIVGQMVPLWRDGGSSRCTDHQRLLRSTTPVAARLLGIGTVSLIQFRSGDVPNTLPQTSLLRTLALDVQRISLPFHARFDNWYQSLLWYTYYGHASLSNSHSSHSSN